MCYWNVRKGLWEILFWDRSEVFDISLVFDSTGEFVACLGVLLIFVGTFLKKHLAHLSVCIYGYDGSKGVVLFSVWNMFSVVV